MKSPEKIAELLREIYEQSFGGKRRGRYKISRINLRELAEGKRLEEVTIKRIQHSAYFDQGLIVEALGDYFAVVEEATMLNYRPVPKSIITKYIPPPLVDDSFDLEED